MKTSGATAVAVTVLALTILVDAASNENKPNVVVFFVDDMGYGELGCYGSKDLRTPFIDSLADNGVRCTAGYVTAPQCGPSRAGILSGKYQQRFGFEANPEDHLRDTFGLNRDIETIGDRMRAAGYKTGAIGKWDLGRAPKDNPINRGFDFYYGSLVGCRNFWPNNNGPAFVRTARGPDTFVHETRYLTYQLTDGALEFIDTYRDDPFFLYISHNAPHWPFEAPEEAIARNDHIENEKRRTYAGMVTALDDSLGRVLKKLRELNLEEKTVILFISDNGSPTSIPSYDGYLDGNNLPLRGSKGTLFEGGIRVPFIVQWKGGALPVGTTYDRPVSVLDVLPTALVIAGATPPPDLPGVNLLPYLKGKKSNEDPVDTLCWRWLGWRAVRAGDWKWVSDPIKGEIGLFNLAKDVGEQNNLVQTQPEKAGEMEALWRRWNRGNAAPQWHPKSLEAMRENYGNEGMNPIDKK